MHFSVKHLTDSVSDIGHQGYPRKGDAGLSSVGGAQCVPSEFVSASLRIEPPIQRDVVVVGASAGGVEALKELVSGLPAEFPAAVLVVLHMASSGTSVLPQILGRHSDVEVGFALDGEQLRRGQVYVAPPDQHMLVHGSRLRLTHGPRENGHRPAIDPLFRSAARAGGSRVIGVVLSGLLDDGASGLQFIREHHGAAVVQDPEDAMFPSMPLAAIALTEPDCLVPISEMADALCALVEHVVEPTAPEEARDRVEIADPAETALMVEGPPTTLTCPECGGTLWESENGGNVRYTCHVGHAYSLNSVVEEQGRSLETTLWSALRALQERADMQRRLARRARGPRRASHEERAKEAEDQAVVLREMLGRSGQLAVAQAVER
jgi:two-component system chemotaxis response regulator CheB